MNEKRFFSYVIVKCADEQRDEALNVGLIVFDPHTQHAVFRAADDLLRIERTLPGVAVAHVEQVLTRAFRVIPQQVIEGGLQALQRIHEEWQNTLRSSRVRSIRGAHIEAVADDLFTRYIAVPSRPPREVQPTNREITSRVVVRSLESQLKQRKLQEDKDFTFNARLFGATSSNAKVPVHFPLRVHQFTLLDGLNVNLSNELLTLDFARSIAQKVEETFRAREEYRIGVAIRDRFDSPTGAYAEEIISSEGRLNGFGPVVKRYSDPEELQDFLDEMQVGQFPLPFEANSGNRR